MIPQPPDQSIAEDLDLRSIALAIWRGKWILIGTTGLFSAVAVVYAFSLTPIYRAEAIVQVRDEAKSGGWGAVAAQLGGLAELSGLMAGSDGDRSLTLATLKSRVLIQSFLQDKELLPVLFSDLWNPSTKRWNVEAPKEQPNLWLGHKFFTEEVLRVSEDKKTGLVTVAIEWPDPQLAAAWATELIARTNAYLREQAIQETERNLVYLQQQLRRTGQVELQRSAYGLVESELKKLMLAKGNEEYAIKTVDPAQPPSRRFKPNRTLITIGGFIFGGIVGLLIMLLKSEFHPRRVA